MVFLIFLKIPAYLGGKIRISKFFDFGSKLEETREFSMFYL
jgi:hypothetical protein